MLDSPWQTALVSATACRPPQRLGQPWQPSRGAFQYATGHPGPLAAGPPWPGQAGFSRTATSIIWQPEHALLILSRNGSWRLPPE